MDALKTGQPCKEPRTNAEKDWPYDEYYIGERDSENRKTGRGQHFWSGAESLERYTGRFLRDTKHGLGEYVCRHRGADDRDISWEGHYYNNYKHGYGLMSYRNGQVFSGLYHSDIRWGPGIETHISLQENVGLWNGNELVRLTWKPPLYGMCPDLMSTSIGIYIVAKHRTLLVANAKTIGETNAALELLKQYGAPPLEATKKWPKLYPKNCTDDKSQFFQTDVFDRDFYGNTIYTLEPTNLKPDEIIKKDSQASSTSGSGPHEIYYTWNNNENIIHMMRHCYQHENQIKQPRINLNRILNGPRSYFKPAAQDELDCRTFLIACYLGHIRNVAQLINEYDVCPNVTDIQGNSAIMYAACGNQPEIINFLVEAGGRVNDYNDACCTPLGAALIHYACNSCDIVPSKIVQAILPASIIIPPGEIISEWKIDREGAGSDQGLPSKNSNSNKPAKPPQNNANKMKPSASVPTKPGKIGEQGEQENADVKHAFEPFEPFSEDKRLYFNLLNEYASKVSDLYGAVDLKALPTVPYIFEVNDMAAEIYLAALEEQQKKVPDKKDLKGDGKKVSRVMTALALTDADKFQMTSHEQMKRKSLDEQMATIKQLLKNGADPRRVSCPQSALFIAIVAQCSKLVELLIEYGADPNEAYPESLGYSPLDIAVSKPFSYDNLDVMQKLLEGGAIANHRIPLINNASSLASSNLSILPGPTLLHAVLAKKIVVDSDDKIRQQYLELLLDYACDPIAPFNGRSAMEIAMSKDVEIINIFIESPNTKLNAVINDLNQTILVKMFFLPYCRTLPVADRLQLLTSLLLYGADPLLKCQNGDNCYENLFMYTKQAEADLLNAPVKPSSLLASKDSKKPKPPEPKKNVASTGKVADMSKSTARVPIADDVGDFKQTLSLVKDCARILYIRWLQAKLMKDIIIIADKYKHRNWVMILKEYRGGKRCGLWLTAVRCLEIWDILKSTKKKIYNDKIVLKYVLCIVHYHFKKRHKILREITSADKTSIETEVAYFVREHTSTPNTALADVLKRPYVKPELTHESEYEKFNICFECALPIREGKLRCNLCKLVEFCSFECMKENINRINCHPCSNYLKKKYFPAPETVEPEDRSA